MKFGRTQYVWMLVVVFLISACGSGGGSEDKPPLSSRAAANSQSVAVSSSQMSSSVSSSISVPENALSAVSIADSDGDEVADAVDNCPAVSNRNQVDANLDGVGDVCDASLPEAPEGFTLCSPQTAAEDNPPKSCHIRLPAQMAFGVNGTYVFIDVPDDEGLGVMDFICERAPFRRDPTPGQGKFCFVNTDSFGPVDSDLDGVANDIDNCWDIPNSDQQDTAGNGRGDACDFGETRALLSVVPATIDSPEVLQHFDQAFIIGESRLIHWCFPAMGDDEQSSQPSNANEWPQHCIQGELSDDYRFETPVVSPNGVEVGNYAEGVLTDDGVYIVITTPEQDTEVFIGLNQNLDDADGDAIPDENDNCVDIFNPSQQNRDETGFGDACAFPYSNLFASPRQIINTHSDSNIQLEAFRVTDNGLLQTTFIVTNTMCEQGCRVDFETSMGASPLVVDLPSEIYAVLPSDLSTLQLQADVSEEGAARIRLQTSSGEVSYEFLTQRPDIIDSDDDFIPDVIDNCPWHSNVLQIDSDADGAGNVCDSRFSGVYKTRQMSFEKNTQTSPDIEQALILDSFVIDRAGELTIDLALYYQDGNINCEPCVLSGTQFIESQLQDLDIMAVESLNFAGVIDGQLTTEQGQEAVAWSYSGTVDTQGVLALSISSVFPEGDILTEGASSRYIGLRLDVEDKDSDLIADFADNCPLLSNVDQVNTVQDIQGLESQNDERGDACTSPYMGYYTLAYSGDTRRRIPVSQVNKNTPYGAVEGIRALPDGQKYYANTDLGGNKQPISLIIDADGVLHWGYRGEVNSFLCNADAIVGWQLQQIDYEAKRDQIESIWSEIDLLNFRRQKPLVILGIQTPVTYPRLVDAVAEYDKLMRQMIFSPADRTYENYEKLVAFADEATAQMVDPTGFLNDVGSLIGVKVGATRLAQIQKILKGSLFDKRPTLAQLRNYDSSVQACRFTSVDSMASVDPVSGEITGEMLLNRGGATINSAQLEGSIDAHGNFRLQQKLAGVEPTMAGYNTLDFYGFQHSQFQFDEDKNLVADATESIPLGFKVSLVKPRYCTYEPLFQITTCRLKAKVRSLGIPLLNTELNLLNASAFDTDKSISNGTFDIPGSPTTKFFSFTYKQVETDRECGSIICRVSVREMNIPVPQWELVSPVVSSYVALAGPKSEGIFIDTAVGQVQTLDVELVARNLTGAIQTLDVSDTNVSNSDGLSMTLMQDGAPLSELDMQPGLQRLPLQLRIDTRGAADELNNSIIKYAMTMPTEVGTFTLENELYVNVLNTRADRDKDGIANYIDLCPNDSGLAPDGCPAGVAPANTNGIHTLTLGDGISGVFRGVVTDVGGVHIGTLYIDVNAKNGESWRIPLTQATAKFDDSGRFRGTARIKSLKLGNGDGEQLDFGQEVELDFGIDQGKNLSNLDVPLVDEKDYVFFKFKNETVLKLGDIALNSGLVPQQKITLAMDPNDPFLYGRINGSSELSGSKYFSSIDNVGIGISTQGNIPFEADVGLLENITISDSDKEVLGAFDNANLLLRGDIPLKQFPGVTVGGDIYVSAPMDDVFNGDASGFAFGANGTVTFSTALSDDENSLLSLLNADLKLGQATVGASSDGLIVAGISKSLSAANLLPDEIADILGFGQTTETELLAKISADNISDSSFEFYNDVSFAAPLLKDLGIIKTSSIPIASAYFKIDSDAVSFSAKNRTKMLSGSASREIDFSGTFPLKEDDWDEWELKIVGRVSTGIPGISFDSDATAVLRADKFTIEGKSDFAGLANIKLKGEATRKDLTLTGSSSVKIPLYIIIAGERTKVAEISAKSKFTVSTKKGVTAKVSGSIRDGNGKVIASSKLSASVRGDSMTICVDLGDILGKACGTID